MGRGGQHYQKRSSISEVTCGAAIGSTIVIFRFMVQDISDKPYLQFCFVPNQLEDRGSTVAKVMCYKSEGRRLDPSWRHWNFSLT